MDIYSDKFRQQLSNEIINSHKYFKQLSCIIFMMKTAELKQFLPIGFADKLLDCEIMYKLTDIPSQQLISCLMKLYRIGMDHFKSVQSFKQLYFQLKINEILMSSSSAVLPKLEQIRDSEQETKKKQRNSRDFRELKKSSNCDLRYKLGTLDQPLMEKGEVKNKSNIREQLLQFTKQKTNRQNIRKMITESQLKCMENQEKLIQEIANQDTIFLKKLERRLSRRGSKLLEYQSISTVDESVIQIRAEGKTRTMCNAYQLTANKETADLKFEGIHFREPADIEQNKSQSITSP